MTGFHLRGTGFGIRWMREHVSHEGDECLIWPMSRHPTGYGNVSVDGIIYYSHRYMCELAHGPAPTPEHEAAHSCGRGHDGCVHPGHLSWKTPAENQADRKVHGTDERALHQRSWRITREQREEIVALKGRMTQREIANRYGISFQSVSHLHRYVVKENTFYEREDAYLRANRPTMTAGEIAKVLGRTESSIYRRLNRLGIRKVQSR
jgi:hypothetical protein